MQGAPSAPRRRLRALRAAVGILALLGAGLATVATTAAAQGPLARTYGVHGFSALGARDFAGASREFTAALDLDPSYVDAYVGRAMAGIAQDRLLESWSDLQSARRRDDDAARKAAVDELMQGIEVATRLASYGAFLTGAKRDAEAVQVAEWAVRFRATLYSLPPEETEALGFAPDEVLKKYAADLLALGRSSEAIQTEAIADGYRRHRMENWRRQQQQYESEK